MTREDAITVLNMVEAHGSLVVQAKDMAIKALEQENVLDKIRAEIMSLTNGNTPERIWNIDVLQIIDKYKTESEVI